jgi:hypothetical protein
MTAAIIQEVIHLFDRENCEKAEAAGLFFLLDNLIKNAMFHIEATNGRD